MTSTSAAVAAIRHLNRRKQFPVEFKSVLLACDTDSLGLCRWIQRYRRGELPRTTTSRDVAKYFDAETFPGGSSRDLFSGKFSCSSPSLTTYNPAEEPQFTVLGAPEAGEVAGKVDPGESITHLPISLESLARFVEYTARSMSVQRNASNVDRVNLLQIQSGNCDIHPSLSECIKLLLPPRSVDLMIVDFPQRKPAAFMHDSLVVSSFLLSSNSSLLFVCSSDKSDHNYDAFTEGALRRFAKLKFRESCWRHLSEGGGGARYFYGTSIAGVEVGRAVDRSDFPGFLPKGKKRVRRWNPYERHKFNYFEFLGPSFATARYTRESFQDMLNQKKEEEETLTKKSEELFEVSFEMVEKQSFYSKRDD
ncbi:unnamed protein product [Phytomonas sp. EM1]|nr:unnamed protein product [Phytomonas sp. EM1]|eukprot:CCW61028.1 unnamed protein product [Phytomonas sp. isolate EM1]